MTVTITKPQRRLLVQALLDFASAKDQHAGNLRVTGRHVKAKRLERLAFAAMLLVGKIEAE